MKTPIKTGPVRMLPEEVTNKIAAGEVVERPASVVKELVENALDAGATRIAVRLVAAGRRTIEVTDNGAGMSEQDALLAVERHTTSKIRNADDLDNILSFGFRGEALASIAAVSRMELVTRREKDDTATCLRLEGGILRDVSQTAAPVGTRITVNRLYFNTPVRAKFLKGITTELGQCIDWVQRYALVADQVAIQLFHNDKLLLDIPENASLRDRTALIWGLSFMRDLAELDGEGAGMRFSGLIGSPNLTRSGRTHQFFFLNGRPIVNRALQYGFEDGYRQLLTIGRRPVGIVLLEAPPRAVDINIHPSKREVRFRDERAAQGAIRDVVRATLGQLRRPEVAEETAESASASAPSPINWPDEVEQPETEQPAHTGTPEPTTGQNRFEFAPPPPEPGEQTEFVASRRNPAAVEGVAPAAVYHGYEDTGSAPMQIFDSYLLMPEEDRLLIIDQHALHERLTYDALRAELADRDYEAQQLVVPLLVDVPPSYVRTLETNLKVFADIGIEIEPFGDHTFQVTSVCPVYDEAKIPDTIYKVLEHLAQGDLFSTEQIRDDLLRLAVEACRGSVKAGDRLSPEERQGLIEGFRNLRPPYTCPHGRPIITELTQVQMEKSFRRRQ